METLNKLYIITLIIILIIFWLVPLILAGYLDNGGFLFLYFIWGTPSIVLTIIITEYIERII